MQIELWYDGAYVLLLGVIIFTRIVAWDWFNNAKAAKANAKVDA
ncbi:MAG: hypothetical protein WBF49_06560 [Methyloceanibacter sp.]